MQMLEVAGRITLPYMLIYVPYTLQLPDFAFFYTLL